MSSFHVNADTPAECAVTQPEYTAGGEEQFLVGDDESKAATGESVARHLDQREQR